MKRLLAMLLIVALIGCMFTVCALADEVTSPERENTEVETKPTSPQTGGIPVVLVAAAAVVLGGGAWFFVRKARG